MFFHFSGAITGGLRKIQQQRLIDLTKNCIRITAGVLFKLSIGLQHHDNYFSPISILPRSSQKHIQLILSLGIHTLIV